MQWISMGILMVVSHCQAPNGGDKVDSWLWKTPKSRLINRVIEQHKQSMYKWLHAMMTVRCVCTQQQAMTLLNRWCTTNGQPISCTKLISARGGSQCPLHSFSCSSKQKAPAKWILLTKLKFTWILAVCKTEQCQMPTNTTYPKNDP